MSFGFSLFLGVAIVVLIFVASPLWIERFDKKLNGAKMFGYVKWFNESKGFGFISPEAGGEDLFVHFSEIQCEGFKTLHEGQRVSYEERQYEKGKAAVKVVVEE